MLTVVRFTRGLVLCLLFCTRATAIADALSERLDEIVGREAFATGWVGVAIVKPGDRAPLYEFNAGKAMLPASTMKTVSCAFALEKLGPSFVFHTPVVATSEPTKEGVVAGPLYIVGSGYPYTYVSTFEDLAARLVEAGVTFVNGDILADVSRFAGDRWHAGWTVDDLLYYYGALPDAINLNRQRVHFTIRPGEIGGPAQVTVDLPEAPILYEVLARTTEAGSHTDIEIDRPLGSNRYVVSGTVAADAEAQEVRRALPDPGLAAAAVLRARLVERGVRVTGGIGYGVAPQGAVELASVDSPPLAEAIEVVLKYSDNLGAELMLWNTGVETGAGSRFEDSLQALHEWLVSRQMPMAGLRLSDGSGLSRYDLLTPRFLAYHLAAMTGSTHFEVFLQSLPLAGVDGTLASRFRGGVVEGKVYAKTGSLSRVSCLAGYAPRPDGQLVAFALMFNSFDCPLDSVFEAQEQILEAILTVP